MVDWAAIATEVHDALASIGQGGAAYVATLQKPAAPGGTAWAPTYGEAVNSEITIVQEFKQTRDNSGALIGRTVHRLLVSAAGGAPAKNDRIALVAPAAVEAGTRWHEVGEVRPLAPAGVAVMYEVDLVD